MTPVVCLVVCLTIMFVVVFAKCGGCSLPLLAEKIGLDPAVMASPFITTIVDATSLLIYFRFASWLLAYRRIKNPFQDKIESGFAPDSIFWRNVS